MKLSALGSALLAACATGVGSHGMCGGRAPIEMTVDSDHYNDTVIRDANGNRLGVAPGHAVTHWRYCYQYPIAAVFILDPISEKPYRVGTEGTLEPGSSVGIRIGSDIAISFVTVTPP